MAIDIAKLAIKLEEAGDEEDEGLVKKKSKYKTPLLKKLLKAKLKNKGKLDA